MAKIITLGEIMLRLSTPNHQRFVQANQFHVTYGGGEANVAIGLAQWNESAYFVSLVPDNPIGKAAIKHLKGYGVHTDYVLSRGERLGIYYLESGVSLRASQVIYDRAHSAISKVKSTDFNFDDIFKEAQWFHFSGITPALSDDAAALVLQACKAAKKHKVTVSVDLNYRKKLWSKEKAQSIMKPLMAYVDVCIGNEEDAQNVLGYIHDSTDVLKGELNLEEYKVTLQKMVHNHGFKVVVTTLRESLSASHNKWQAMAFDGENFIQSKQYDIFPIVDRVGGGDSFAAGLIYGLLHKKNLSEALEFATAASALKHTIEGDQNLVTIDEVERLLKGDASGRVQR